MSSTDAQQIASLDAMTTQAVTLHQAGQLYQAEQLYRQIIQSFPRHADANHNLGLMATQAGAFEAALQHFKIAYEVLPGNPQFVLGYANALVNNGFAADARKVIKTARQAGMDGPEFKNALRIIDELINEQLTTPGPTLAEWDPLDKAFREQRWVDLEALSTKLGKQYAKSGRVFGMLAVALQSQGKDFIAAKRKAAQLRPMDINLQFSLATDLRNYGFMADAEAALRTAIKHHPETPQAHYNLGLFLSDSDRAVEAMVCLGKATELRPDFIAAHCAIAVLQHRAGQPEAAQESIQRALAVEAKPAPLLAVIGQTYAAIGQYETGAGYLNQSLELAPDNPEVLVNLGDVLKILGLRNDAEKCYLRALQLQPGYALAHNSLGVLLQENGDHPKAATCFDRACSLVPNFVSGLANGATSYLVLGRFAEAFERLRIAVRLAQNDPLIHCNLGLALQGLGQFDQAIQCYQNALQLAPDFAFASANLGSVYALQGKKDEMEAALTKAMELDPADPRVLALALQHLPYRADDARFAQIEAVYAKRDTYRLNEKILLGISYASAMTQAGATDKAKAAQEEVDRLTAQATAGVSA